MTAALSYDFSAKQVGEIVTTWRSSPLAATKTLPEVHSPRRLTVTLPTLFVGAVPRIRTGPGTGYDFPCDGDEAPALETLKLDRVRAGVVLVVKQDAVDTLLFQSTHACPLDVGLDHLRGRRDLVTLVESSERRQ